MIGEGKAEGWSAKHPGLSKAIAIGFAVILLVIFVDRFSEEGAGPGTGAIGGNTIAKTAQDIPAAAKDIAVSNQIVKHVDGKYRYFFDIRNNDGEAFEGSVTIELIQKSGSTLGRETFETQQPIEPSLGSSVFFDINTGPVPIFDEDLGITGFRYVAKNKDGQTVKSGEGKISDMFEAI